MYTGAIFSSPFKVVGKMVLRPTPDSELPLTCFSKADEVIPLSSNLWSPGNFSPTKFYNLYSVASFFLCADLVENNC